MPYLTVNPDSSIQDITATDENQTGIVVDKSVLKPAIQNEFGHACFDYVDGEIVHNQARHDSYHLAREKLRYTNSVIRRENTITAKARLTTTIQAIDNAADIDALNALKSAP